MFQWISAPTLHLGYEARCSVGVRIDSGHLSVKITTCEFLVGFFFCSKRWRHVFELPMQFVQLSGLVHLLWKAGLVNLKAYYFTA